MRKDNHLLTTTELLFVTILTTAVKFLVNLTHDESE